MQRWSLPYNSRSLERVLSDMMLIEEKLTDRMNRQGLMLDIKTSINYNIDEDIWEGLVIVTYAEESR